jgi:serralysin
MANDPSPSAWAGDTTAGGATSEAHSPPHPVMAGEAAVSTIAFDTVTNDADQNIDALMNNYGTDTLSRYFTNPVVTFSFPDAAGDISYALDNGATFVEALNAAQKSVVRLVLANFGNVTGLSFTELAAGSPDGVLRFAEATPITTAYAYYPGTNEQAGDAWFNPNDYNAPVLGDYAFHTFLHETGHALGLKHGHETDGPGAMTADRDSMEFSVMTYRSAIGASFAGGYQNEQFGYAQSLMMFDIATLQRFYGANFAFNATGSYYTFSLATGEMFINGVGQGTPGANRIFRTVWDGGGVDTYDLSNYTTSLNLDLTPGGWLDLDVGGNFQRVRLIDGGGAGNPGDFSRGHVFNALQYNNDDRSLIEKAFGGSGNDTITGNNADNYLIGNGGTDTINGGGGQDVLTGDAGADILNGGDGNDVISELTTNSVDGDTIDGGNGIDILYANFGNDIVSGGTDTGNNYANLGEGDDSYQGSAGTDVVEGGNGVDTIAGNNGDDSLYGDGGNDIITGGTGIDLLSGSTGDDNLDGGGDNDLLVGDAGNDTLNGGGGIDVLYGFADNDVLNGGAGLDGLYGGTGNDDFRYATTGVNQEYLWDFVGGAGASDRLVFSTTVFANEAAVRAAATFASGNTTITMTDGSTIILVAVNIANLVSDDFSFF